MIGARELAFTRHMTPGKLAARIMLSCKRQTLSRAEALAGWAKPSAGRLPVATAPPMPPFAPRRMGGRLADGALRLAFQNCERRFDGPVAWHAPDLATGTRLWKLNLHYMEYLEGLEDDDLIALSEDWIVCNAPFRPEYWLDSWNSFALSIRVVVWMQQLAGRAERLDSAAWTAMVASLAQQLRFLERNLETDIGGNHLVKNIKALLWGSAFFAGPEAERWRQTGLRLLDRELASQILADGMHYERSPSYQAQVFADLLECRLALGGDALGGLLDHALARMAQATADLAHPDGRAALLNDAGLGMAYLPGECLDVHERIYGSKPAPRRLFALRDAGYFGLRAGGTYFVADCGRIAPDDLPAHGHGDVLSFEWSVGGERVIVDQGVYEYNAGERRQRARAASNHNTLCLDGADQADFFGSFRCGRRPNVEVLAYEKTPGGFVLEGTHDGFRHLSGSPVHVRRFEVSPREVVIRDRLEGRPDRGAAIAFLLAPGTEAEVDGTRATIRKHDIVIGMTSSSPIAIEDAVWWPDIGREMATSRLRVRLARGPQEAVTTFVVISDEATPSGGGATGGT